MKDEHAVTDKPSNLSYDRSCRDIEQPENNPSVQNHSLFDRSLNTNKQKYQENTMSHMKSNSYYPPDERYAMQNITIAPNDLPTLPQYIENAYGVNLMIQSQDGQSIRLHNLPEGYGPIECQMNPFPNNINYIDAQMNPLVNYPGFCNPPYSEMGPPAPFGDPKLMMDRVAITNGVCKLNLDSNPQVCMGPHEVANLRGYNNFHNTQYSSIDSPDVVEYMPGSIERKKSNGRKENHNMIERRYRSQISRCFSDLDSITFASNNNDGGARTKSQILRSAAEKIKLLITENEKLSEENRSLREKVKKLGGNISFDETTDMIPAPTPSNNFDSETVYNQNHQMAYYGKPCSSSVNVIGIILALFVLFHDHALKSPLQIIYESLDLNYRVILAVIASTICWLYLTDIRIRNGKKPQGCLSYILAFYRKVATVCSIIPKYGRIKEYVADEYSETRVAKSTPQENTDISKAVRVIDRFIIGENHDVMMLKSSEKIQIFYGVVLLTSIFIMSVDRRYGYRAAIPMDK